MHDLKLLPTSQYVIYMYATIKSTLSIKQFYQKSCFTTTNFSENQLLGLTGLCF